MKEEHKKIHQKVMASLKKAQQKLGFSDEKVQAILDTPVTAAEEERLKKDMQHFGKQLKAARESAGLSLEELSKKAGCR
ncbi:MAG: hypothetical protein V4615_14145 [Bacteroidota bacterium]